MTTAFAVFAGFCVLAGSAPAQTPDAIESWRAQLGIDAAARTSLLTDHAGFRQGGAPVRLSGLLQVRYTANIRDAEPLAGEESLTHGFSLPRAQLGVDADLNETWSVRVKGGFDVDGGEFALLDAWADWRLDDRWTLRAGQFKTPTTREWLIDPDKQLAADRSAFNQAFSLERTQGIAAIYTAGQFSVIGAFNDGANTGIFSEFNSELDADWAFSGRIDWRFAGDWTQLEDFQGWRGQRTAGLIGAAVHAQDGGSTGALNTFSTREGALVQVVVDAQVEGGGWSVYGAVVWSEDDRNLGFIESDPRVGFLLQGGVFVAESDELFARYDVVDAGDVTVDPSVVVSAGGGSFNTVTIGWNHFFIPESNASRFTLDFQWAPDRMNYLVVDGTETGLLNSVNGQYAIRAQYQAAF